MAELLKPAPKALELLFELFNLLRSESFPMLFKFDLIDEFLDFFLELFIFGSPSGFKAAVLILWLRVKGRRSRLHFLR